MRSEDGKYFSKVVGVRDINLETGAEFSADTVKSERPLSVDDKITIGGTVYVYRGEDNLGCSIFTLPGQLISEVRSASK
jgi:hypothetical protein